MREFVPARTEPEDEAPTIPPPPASPRVTHDGSLAAVETHALGPHSEPQKSWWERNGSPLAIFLALTTAVSAGYAIAKAQATVTAEGIKPVLDRLKSIEDTQKDHGLTIRGVATDVDWLKKALAKTPGVSTNLNVAAHE